MFKDIGCFFMFVLRNNCGDFGSDLCSGQQYIYIDEFIWNSTNIFKNSKKLKKVYFGDFNN
jgi:hypothetical protein